MIVKVKDPLTVGLPLRIAVPFPLLTNVTPLGKAPLSVIVAVGEAGRGDREGVRLAHGEGGAVGAGDDRAADRPSA